MVNEKDNKALFEREKLSGKLVIEKAEKAEKEGEKQATNEQKRKPAPRRKPVKPQNKPVEKFQNNPAEVSENKAAPSPDKKIPKRPPNRRSKKPRISEEKRAVAPRDKNVQSIAVATPAGNKNGRPKKKNLGNLVQGNDMVAPAPPTISAATLDLKGRFGKGKLKIIPLGGIGEIGKNITVFEYENDIIVVDCGLAFPDDEMLGIDLVIPDISYLTKNASKIRGILLTHGHEDHIGSLPYVLRELNVPVYGTRMTLGILRNKLEEAGLLGVAKLFQCEAGDIVKLGNFKVEFIRSNHSIPDAAMLAIHTPLGVVLHTGDFKIDATPIIGDMIDLKRVGELGDQGILALMSDSTNAERPGYTMSESKVGESFDSIFKQNADKRIIIATFASNIHRVQQIMDAAKKYGRKVAVSGRSMINNVEAAVKLGVIKLPDNVLIDISMLNRFPKEQIVLITTGSQGEVMSALYRMAYSDHRQVQVGPGDLIVNSASAIPGNEKLVSRVINELFKLGCDVIYESLAEIHVSGHACREEQKLLLKLARPKYFIPVHGEYRHLIKHAALARAVGVPAENIMILQENGKVIELDRENIRFAGQVQAGHVLIDGLGIGDVGNIVLRDRKHLSEDGLVVIVAAIEKSTGALVSGPDIVSRGFIYVREAEKIMHDAQQAASSAFERCEQNGIRDWSNIKTQVKDAVSNYIFAATHRRPMILPILLEV